MGIIIAQILSNPAFPPFNFHSANVARKIFHPLGQMFAAGLSPFANRWNKIHNFTPDTGKCQILQNAHPMGNPSTNGQLIHRLNQFLCGSQIVEKFQFKLASTFGESQIFFEGQQKANQFADFKVISLWIEIFPQATSTVIYCIENGIYYEWMDLPNNL